MDLAKLTALATGLRESTTRVSARPTSHGKNWYNIRNAGDETIIGIYDEIGEWGVSAQDFVTELNGITTPSITVQIASPGGAVWDGLTIYAALAGHPAHERGGVATDVMSHAFSAASFIAQAASPGKRRIRRNARMMIHDPAIGGGVVFGNARQLREFKDQLETIAVQLDEAADNIADIYGQRSGNTDLAHWRALMEAETFFGSEDAVAAGLADEVVSAGGDSPGNVGAGGTIPTNLALDDFGGLLDSLKGVFRA
jgi:ATP-dependent protease ClpP protease subunit